MSDVAFLGRPPRRKRFGQHFLQDSSVLDRIVSAIDPLATDRIVEIGPGRGALTLRLLESGAPNLDAIEIDRDLTALLRSELAAHPGLSLHQADALEFDFTALAQARGGRLRIVGNLPYNISTPLLFHLVAHAASIDDMHFMLQREVAERIAAGPGSRDYGRLSIMMAPWVDVELLFEVGPEAFEPAPKVWSAVTRLKVRREPKFPVGRQFAKVVATAFCHRRKTLRNSLRGLVELEQILSCGLDPGARPETFPPQAFNALALAIDPLTAGTHLS